MQRRKRRQRDATSPHCRTDHCSDCDGSNSNRDASSGAFAYADPDFNSNADPDFNSDEHPDFNSHADADSNADTDANSRTRSHSCFGHPGRSRLWRPRGAGKSKDRGEF